MYSQMMMRCERAPPSSAYCRPVDHPLAAFFCCGTTAVLLEGVSTHVSPLFQPWGCFTRSSLRRPLFHSLISSRSSPLAPCLFARFLFFSLELGFVKFVIASVPQLFGDDAWGAQVRAWCIERGWALVWSLGASLSSSSSSSSSLSSPCAAAARSQQHCPSLE